MFKTKYLQIVAIALLSTILLTGCQFSYTVKDVPSYCQLGGNRCGAACTQMIIQFCCEKETPPVVPSWYGNLKFNQEYILKGNGAWSGWMKDYHQTHNIPSPYKHPDAVKEAIMELKEGAPGHFVVFHDVDNSKVMHDMLYWIKEIDYPSATMVYGRHWVLVYGFKTDVEPTIGNTVSLDSIFIIDPSCAPCQEPGDGGNPRNISGEGWGAGYWNTGVNFDSWVGKPYHGEYVAVVEPPVTKGRVKIPKAYVGRKEEIIPVESALKKAIGYARKLTGYRFLNFMTKALPQTPLLVEWPDNNRYYYLVPFATDKEGPAKAVMILNPYNGNYYECGALCHPISFVSSKEAVTLTLRKIGITEYEKLTTSLKYVYSNLTCSHYYPFWEINVDGKLYYVGQNREVHEEFAPIR
ncbi:hypothetical protein KAW65_00020 [candidate division WOR-3 bacterium]|nr:hypothetical protein [candidate division WOR-3 bacterium]